MGIQPPQDFQSNQMFTWVDNMPVPRVSKSMQKEQIQQLYHAAGGLPYRGIWNPTAQQYEIEDARFIGATNFEVMVMKDIEAACSSDGEKARERVMDRVLGKPKQAVESTSLTMSYADFLEESARRDAMEDPTLNNYIDLEPDLNPSYDDYEDNDLLNGI